MTLIALLAAGCQKSKQNDTPTEENVNEAFNQVIASFSPPESILTTSNLERVNGTMLKGQQLEDGSFALGTEYEVSLKFNIIPTKIYW